MKLKVQQLMDAMLVISQVIREQRPMPLKGKYRLARLHAKLLPEFNTAQEQRDALIRAYDTHVSIPDPAWDDTGAVNPPMIEGPEFMVPPDKMGEFNEAWGKIANEEIEVDAEPIPLDHLDLGGDGAFHANELIALGDLVKE